MTRRDEAFQKLAPAQAPSLAGELRLTTCSRGSACATSRTKCPRACSEPCFPMTTSHHGSRARSTARSDRIVPGDRDMSPTLMFVVCLAALLAGGDAVANTYFKCVDARGAVTVQQTACLVTSSQQENKAS